MKKGYKIGLFFILIIIVLLVIIIMWKRHTVGGFPNENNNVEQDNMSQDSNNNMLFGVQEYELEQVQRMETITTCDTVCIYENIDKKDGSISMEEKRLPAKYIGLNREELEIALAEDSNVPTLEDRQRGFKSQHLELFSTDKIKILRIYDTTPTPTGYYIMEKNGEISVYEYDKTTVYFKTGLRPENIPVNVRHEIQKGKYMDTELKVYHFIESYSS